MHGKFEVEGPDQISFTLTLTARLKEWRQVKTALRKARDSSDADYFTYNSFIEILDKVISKAEGEFYAAREDEERST